MARLNIFKGGIKLGSGLKPMGDFPLMEAHDIIVAEDGTRLDTKLASIGSGNGGSVEVTTDFTQAGKAADAKAVGDVLGNINDVLENI